MAGFVRQDSRITTHPLPGDSGPMILMELANERARKEISEDMTAFVRGAPNADLPQWARQSSWAADTGGGRDVDGSAVRAHGGEWQDVWEQVQRAESEWLEQAQGRIAAEKKGVALAAEIAALQQAADHLRHDLRHDLGERLSGSASEHSCALAVEQQQASALQKAQTRLRHVLDARVQERAVEAAELERARAQLCRGGQVERAAVEAVAGLRQELAAVRQDLMKERAAHACTLSRASKGAPPPPQWTHNHLAIAPPKGAHHLATTPRGLCLWVADALP